MASDMLRRVDYKLSHVEPLTEEEAQWLRDRLDTLYEKIEDAPTDENASVDLYEEDRLRLKFTGMPPKER